MVRVQRPGAATLARRAAELLHLPFTSHALRPACITGLPWHLRHFHTALARITTTHTIMMMVSDVFTQPWKLRVTSGPMAIGQKLSRTLKTPAVSVVIDTKASGTTVTHMYFALPVLMMIVVATASARAARSWLAMPNIARWY